MKFLVGDKVWAPHPKHGFIVSNVTLMVNNDTVMIKTIDQQSASEEFKVNVQQLSNFNESDDKDFQDMVEIQDLSEASILSNLKKRYQSNEIYTYIGNVLVSINPYKSLPIYNMKELNKYQDISCIKKNAPHIYAISSKAFQSLVTEKKNQSIIISGESGSGKTEASKSILQFLINSSNSLNNSNSSNSINENSIEKDIMDSNPILEAFGNSRTTKNYNSSRFGKFLKIEFSNSDYRIVGASIETYLLEKSRISHRPDKQNLNYHIFYYLVWGASKEEQKKWGIVNDPSKYRYLDAEPQVLESYKQHSMNAKDLSENYRLVKQSMLSLGLSVDECDNVFLVLSSILHLGNIEFEQDSLGSSSISTTDENVNKSLEMASQMLGFPTIGLFKRALTSRNLQSGGRGSVYSRPLDVSQSEQARDALSKSLYFKIFQYIVEKINQKFKCNNNNSNSNSNHNNNSSGIKKNNNNNNFIGVLDIFGFENLSINGLEQLLINFTNEKLQQQFNSNVFESEQKEYIQEGIAWNSASFIDNKECIELVEKKSYGLISLLDDECLMPKGSETSLLEKFNGKYMNHNPYYQRTLAKGTFGVKHFAGEVVYQTDGWLEKNRDTLLPDIEYLLISSSNSLVKFMFTQNIESSPTLKSSTPSPAGSPLPSKKTANSSSVCGQFLDQLSKLVSTINSTTVHYVRCIKPNTTMEADNFSSVHVLSQLRNVGVLNTVQIRKMGYSYRRDFDVFSSRYINILFNLSEITTTAITKNHTIKQQTEYLLNFLSILLDQQASPKKPTDKKSFHIGKTKVFLSDELYNFLEIKRYEMIVESAKVIQRFLIMTRTRKLYLEKKRSTILIQNVIRGYASRKEKQHLVLIETKQREEEMARELEKKKKEEERLRKEEEERQKELEKKRKEEEERARKEEERLKKEEEKKKKEEDKLKKEEEERKRKRKEIGQRRGKEKEKGKRRYLFVDIFVTCHCNFTSHSSSSSPSSSTSTSTANTPKSFVGGNDSTSITPSSIDLNNNSNNNNNNSNQNNSIIVSSDSNFGLEKKDIGTNNNETTFIDSPPSSLKSSPIPIKAVNAKWNSPSSSPTMNEFTRSRARIGRLTIRSASPISMLSSDVAIGKNKFSLSQSTPGGNGGGSNGNKSDCDEFTDQQNNRLSTSSVSSSNDDISPMTLSPSVSCESLPAEMSEELLLEKNKRLRTEIIKEIVMTEKDYVRDLSIVINTFLIPIREKAILNAKEINILFSNIEILYNVNKTVLEELEKDDDEHQQHTFENTKVGQAFLKMSHYLKMYTAYCSSQHASLKLLEDEKMKNQPFRDFLDERMDDPTCRGLPLISFIIKPVQRICKYPLLIKECIRYTAEDHPDRSILEEVDKKISDIVLNINEAKRSYDMFQKIVELQSSIEGLEDLNLMEPGRALLMEANVSSVKELNSEDSLQRFIFLFNNLILVCSPASVITNAINQFKSKKYIYKLKAKIPITQCRLMFVANTDSVKNAIELCNIKENSNYILCFHTEQERARWMKQIKLLIQEFKFNNSGKSLIGFSRSVATSV
ncbi:hypothetical protein CYY_008648 [Polysphondylium violaceum]|uniref:Pleckstrin domain-containing protein n=1 Tax=Polysphondylium violaceum TaxID=133409 RepID=A0A8J4PMN4_9MYCE|nr:hypothetical protein CYY_008648 [Polysphondylium violaceum]